MSNNDESPLIACTVSRDIQYFDLLIEDMEMVFDESWGDLGFEDALPFLGQSESNELAYLIVAMDSADIDQIDTISAIIAKAKTRDVKVVLVIEDISPADLHTLRKAGAEEFIPYPLPENELAATIERLETTPAVEEYATAAQRAPKVNEHRNGAIIAIHGMAGGTGSTTFAVNLAWELANLEAEKVKGKGKERTKEKIKPPTVCIIDLDLQFGSVSSYLDLPRREAVFELLSSTETMDADALRQAMLAYEDKVFVLTAPADILPLDIISPVDVQRILDVARDQFDYVIVDLPKALVNWSETVLSAAQVYFAIMDLDMRSAQNTLRLKHMLQGEDLDFDKLRFVLNRAPSFTDLAGKSRIKRMAESLGIAVDLNFPDGGKQVTASCDHGLPLGLNASKNPLRKEITKLAVSLHKIGANYAAEE